MRCASVLVPLAGLIVWPIAPASAQGRPALDRVLHRWIQAYEKDALKLHELAVVRGKVAPIYGKGWLGAVLLDATHRAGLANLLDHAAKAPTVEVAKQVLRLAAIGLLDGKATLARPHFAVRHLGGLALSRMDSTDCMFFLMKVADGDLSAFRKRPEDAGGFRVAAIFALGTMRKPVVRPTLQRQLRAENPIVRLATAEALGRLRHPRALEDLASAMRTETHAVVAQALVRSVRSILQLRGEEVGPRQRSAVVQSALGLLGRTDWRADLEVVGLLAKLRSAAAVPALIGILERKRDASSGRLTAAAGETLKSLTGAILPADQPAKWREYWAEVESTFVVPAPPELVSSRTTAGFFGLPVEGSNVVFLIDTSGSMGTAFFPTGEFEPDATAPDQTRMNVAKAELLKAVKGMSKESRFNVVSFATHVAKWRRKVVRPTRSVRAELTQTLRKMKAVGATNIFGALEAGLGIKALSYGSRYESAVDEVFLLSDGEPTTGRVKDPVTILQLIRETNRYSAVRIHTIYMGGGGGSEFMETLARQNGGRYIHL